MQHNDDFPSMEHLPTDDKQQDPGRRSGMGCNIANIMISHRSLTQKISQERAILAQKNTNSDKYKEKIL